MDTYTFTEDQTAIVKALKTVNDVGSDVERVYHEFAKNVAGKTRAPIGVLNGWNLAIETVRRYEGAAPAMLFILMDMDFDEYMRSVITDSPTFADAVIAVKQMVHDAQAE